MIENNGNFNGNYLMNVEAEFSPPLPKSKTISGNRYKIRQLSQSIKCKIYNEESSKKNV